MQNLKMRRVEKTIADNWQFSMTRLFVLESGLRMKRQHGQLLDPPLSMIEECLGRINGPKPVHSSHEL